MANKKKGNPSPDNNKKRDVNSNNGSVNNTRSNPQSEEVSKKAQASTDNNARKNTNNTPSKKPVSRPDTDAKQGERKKSAPAQSANRQGAKSNQGNSKSVSRPDADAKQGERKKSAPAQGAKSNQGNSKPVKRPDADAKQGERKKSAPTQSANRQGAKSNQDNSKPVKRQGNNENHGAVHSTEPETEKRPPSAGRVFAYIGLGLMTVAIIAVLLVIWFVNRSLDKFDRNTDPEVLVQPDDEWFETDSGSGEVIHPDSIVWGDYNDVIENDDDVITILLVGQDYSSTGPGSRSDSMIVCSFNVKTERMVLMSLMRDLYVQIPGGYSDNRINSSYSFGGLPLLTETIKHNFGLTVDGCVVVDFNSFVEIIDILGGVDVDVTKAESNFIHSRYPDYIYRAFSEGMCHLNGKQTLVYSRIRKFDNGDFGRTARQRKVLTALYNSFKNISIDSALELINTIFPKIKTDLTNGQIIDFAMKVLPHMADSTIDQYQIPVEGSYRMVSIRRMSVLLPDIETNREAIRNALYPEES